MNTLALLCAALSSAGRPVGFEEAIRLGADSSLQAVAARSRARESRAGVDEATARLVPHVELAASKTERSYNFLTGGVEMPGLEPRVPFYSIEDVRVRATAPLLSIEAWDRRSEALARSEAAGRQSEVATETVRLQAGLAWLDLARAQALEADRRVALGLAAELVRMTDDQHAAGGATGLDLVRAKGQEMQAERALDGAVAARIQAAGVLAAVLGLPETDSVYADAPLPLDDAPGSGVPDAGEAASVAAARASLDVAREASDGAGRAWWPVVGVSADYGLSGRHLQDDGEWTGTVAVAATWEVWDGGTRGARESAAGERLLQARRALAQAQRDAGRERTQSLALLERTRSALRSAREACGLADSELVLSREKFRGGASGNLEVVQAQASRTQAHAGWIEAAAAHRAAALRARWAFGRWNEGEGR